MASASTPFIEQMAKMVLEMEVSYHRFEDFCIEMFRDSDGIEYVRTSKSWDLGRDGRGSGLNAKALEPFISCSLRGDHKAKVTEDVNRILESDSPKGLLICV